MSKDIDFWHLQEIYPTNLGKDYWKLLQKLDATKTASFEVDLKELKPHENWKEIKSLKQMANQNLSDINSDMNSRNVEQIVIPPEKKEKLLNELTKTS